MGRQRAFFSLKTQFENVGDALINRELVRMVSSRADTVVDLSRCPSVFRRTLGLSNLKNVELENGARQLFVSLVKARLAGETVYYFLSPGGYFGEISGLRKLSAWINTGILYLLTAIGVRVCHVGVSYEGLGPANIRMLRARGRILFRHLVRDEASRALMLEKGIRVHRRMPDLAVGAAGSGAPHPSGKRSTLALSIRVDQVEDQQDTMRRFAVELARELPEDIPFKVVVQAKRDLEFARGLVAHLVSCTARPVSLVDCSSDIEACIDAYRDCQFVVANRLHALLIGAIAGTTPIAIVNPEVNKKIVALLEDWGVGANLFDIGAADAGRMVAQAMLHEKDLSQIDVHDKREALASIADFVFPEAALVEDAQGCPLEAARS